MARRKPIPPSFEIKDNRPTDAASARRRAQVPYQERISVQDIPTNATLGQVISMENEDMRRLALKIEQLEEQQQPVGGADTPGGVSPSPVSEGSVEVGDGVWALTTEHNDNIITAKVVQDLDYHDTGGKRPKYEIGVFWELTQQMLEAALKTIPQAKKTRIKAWAATHPKQFLEWVDICLRPIKSIRGKVDNTEGSWNYILDLVNDEWSPGPKKYYGTDKLGAKGFHLFPGVHVIKIPFNYGTPAVSSRTTVPENNLILRVETVITEVFDDVVAYTASVGTIEIMDETYINFARDGMYLNQWHYAVTDAAVVDLVISTPSTQGAGVTYVWYTEPEL